ncbi:MAG TPA: metalloregulator ArsR/SmtB family transcription factor [bacterium]|nr:metalloregulator ArsR/SmtB family transcription factor [bacterium]
MPPAAVLTLPFLENVAGCLRAVAHPVRLQLLDLLESRRLSVTDLAERAGIAQPAASQHLRLMARAGIVAPKREGQTVYYVVVDPRILDVLDCLRRHCV